MNIFNISSSYNFLEKIVDFTKSITSEELSLSKMTILLPSRRSCNELKRLFLEKSDGAIILPKIIAIGDIDYDDLLLKSIQINDLKNFTEISANTSRIKYKILLIKELIKWSKNSDKDLFKNINIEQTCNLALELEKFLNEVVKSNLSLDRLSGIVDDEYSKHWQEVLEFLQTFSNGWNRFIKENNIISNIDFKTKMIDFNAEFFEKNKPENTIIFAGVNGNTKHVSKLIKNLLQYENCYFIFKGLDYNLTDEEWDEINVFHPQYYFKKILNYLNFERKNVKNLFLNSDNNLEKALSFAMLPYNFTYKWQNKTELIKDNFSNISKIECSNIFEELNIIFYILKYNQQQSNKTMAVITTNDVFAEKLELILKESKMKCINVFGNNFSRTEIIKYLFLILDVIKSDFQIIPLLSLLKHRFSLFNYNLNELEELILEFENIIENKGSLKLKEIKVVLNGNEKLEDFFNKIFDFLQIKVNKNFSEILKNHISVAEKIASNNEIDGSEIFYKNENNGNDILDFLNNLVVESESYGNVNNLNEYSNILNYLIAENSYSESYSIHPTISIISPKEARLINYDLVIVSNLNDGNFPLHISTDPWMSKSMRTNFGLPDKEETIGDYAYDFVELLHNKEVILTRSLKEDGVPTVKSKYLMRLETFLLCQNLKIKEDNIWKDFFNFNHSIKDVKHIFRPKPTPPLEKRPKKLYATKIEKLMKNPYDIYAEKILKLNKKNNFNDDNLFVLFGSAVHASLEKYVKNYENLSKDDLFNSLLVYGKESFREFFVNEISRELFFIRFVNIAKWFIEEDEKIRKEGYEIISEKNEEYYFSELGFCVAGKIDRIEIDKNNNINIVDYKTGTAPKEKEVKEASKPQLSIESVILKNKNYNINNISYWVIKGKNEDEVRTIEINIKLLIEKTEDGLKNLIRYFNEEKNPFICTCYELQNNQYQSDYKHLSRVEEWGYL